jgi:hypothetical protein
VCSRRLRHAVLALCLVAVADVVAAPPDSGGRNSRATADGAAVAAQAPVERATRQSISDSDVDAAVAQVKADPNLSPTRTMTVPRWNWSINPTASWGWLKWITQFFNFLAQSSRALVWTAVIALAIALLVYFARTLAARNARDTIDRMVTPTHVRDLDIRPESLPPDIGAAARALWDAGQRRAALALLYRGLLSRLAHVHRVPIRDSTTEGDCLELTRHHLTVSHYEYAARLIKVWQRAVYGGTEAEAPIVYELCDAFAGALDTGPGAAQVTA